MVAFCCSAYSLVCTVKRLIFLLPLLALNLLVWTTVCFGLKAFDCGRMMTFCVCPTAGPAHSLFDAIDPIRALLPKERRVRWSIAFLVDLPRAFLSNRFVSSREWLSLQTLLARLLRSVESISRGDPHRLAEMLSYLQFSRQYLLWFLLGISAVGLADLVFVGLIARLVGSFSGSSLVDNLPFVRVFGGDSLDSGLIVGFRLGLIWFSTARNSSPGLWRGQPAVWAVLGNRVYGNLILQTYDYFKDSSSTKLLTRLNRVLSKVSDGVVLPLLAICSNALSAGILIVGVVVAFGWIPVVFGLLVVSYRFIGVDHAQNALLTKQQFLYNQRVNGLLVESTNHPGWHLHGFEQFFIFASMTSARKASAMTGC